MRAAILEEAGKELIVDDVDLAPPSAGEVKVRIRCTGFCHSDYSIVAGKVPWPLPTVLGHEAAGEVVEVGENVTTVATGDHVVVSWIPVCGRCFFCVNGQPNLCQRFFATLGTMDDGTSRLSRRGESLSHWVGCATFAEEAILREDSLVKIDDNVPFDVAALIGCAVLTGVGAALNTARILPAERVAVVGCGGVGMSVIQGCRVAGATTIIAIDPVPEKRDLALTLGATHAVSPEEAMGQVFGLTDSRGVDAVFEVVGRGSLQELAFNLTRMGGRAVMVGVAPAGDVLTLPAMALSVMEKRILGCNYGSTNPRRDVGRIVALWRAGRLDLEALITSRFPLERINDALAEMEKATGIRSVLTP